MSSRRARCLSVSASAAWEVRTSASSRSASSTSAVRRAIDSSAAWRRELASAASRISRACPSGAPLARGFQVGVRVARLGAQRALALGRLLDVGGAALVDGARLVEPALHGGDLRLDPVEAVALGEPAGGGGRFIVGDGEPVPSPQPAVLRDEPLADRQSRGE